MKRRFKSDDGCPPNVQCSSSGGFARGLESDHRYVKSKAKRVRFTGVDRDPLPNNRSDDASTGCNTSREPRSEIPKTSEYAFFKKVKEAIIQSDQHSLNKESEQKMKDIRHYYPNIVHKEKENTNSNANDYICEVLSKSKMLNGHTKDIKLPIQSEKAGLNNQCLFVSPVKGRCNSPREACPEVAKHWTFSHPMDDTTLDQNLQLSPQTAPKLSVNTWSEVFSAKRQKLRQEAEIALAGTENLSSKGYDLVTMLLSRLSPGSNENKGSKITGHSGCLPVYPEPDPSSTRHHQSYIQDLTEPEYGSWRCSELSSCSIETKEIIPVHWPAFPTDNCFTKYNETVDNNHDSNSVTAKRLLKQRDSPVHLLFGKSGLTDWYHLNEPDSFYCLNESPRRELKNFLLDWDFNKDKNEPETTVTTNRCEDKMHSQIVTVWDSNLQKSIDTRHDTMALCSSSLFFDHSPHFCVLPDVQSTSLQEELYFANFHTRGFGRNVEYEEYSIAEPPDHLSSLYDTEYLDPEDYGDSNKYEYGNAITYFLDYPQGSPVQVFSEKYHLDSDAFLLPEALNKPEWNNRSAYTIQSDKAWNLGSSSSEIVAFQEV